MNYRQLPDITEKQEEIMSLVYRFRFINRKQLQRYLNHKDPRRINEWLKDLVKKNYLGRIYSHSFLENTKPAIYFLNNNGIIWVRYEKGNEYGREEGLDIKYLKKFYEDKHASKSFIDHCTTIFDYFVQLVEAEREANKEIIKLKKKSKDYDEDLDKKLEYYVETKTEMWIQKQLHIRKSSNEDFDEIKQYIPDLYFEKFKYLEDGKMESNTYFLESFGPRVPKYGIKYRIKQYIKLKEEGEWKHSYTGMDGKFPLIILVFPHFRKMNSLTEYIRNQLFRSLDSEGIIFLLTTYQKAMTKGLGDPTIYQIIKEE